MIKTFSKKDINKSLRRVMSLNMQISAKTEELLRWRELSEKTSGAAYSHAKSSVRRGNRIEDCIIKIDAIERAIKADLDKLMLLEGRISETIERMNDPVCESLLRLRYLNAMSWERVAECMDYSYVHIVHRLHPKALEKFDGLYSEEGGI